MRRPLLVGTMLATLALPAAAALHGTDDRAAMRPDFTLTAERPDARRGDEAFPRGERSFLEVDGHLLVQRVVWIDEAGSFVAVVKSLASDETVQLENLVGRRLRVTYRGTSLVVPHEEFAAHLETRDGYPRWMRVRARALLGRTSPEFAEALEALTRLGRQDATHWNPITASLEVFFEDRPGEEPIVVSGRVFELGRLQMPATAFERRFGTTRLD